MPNVIIVGKPNVGKSTLFNKMIKKRKSIVDDFPGVTRDSVYEEVRFNDRTFRLIDTCGLFGEPQDEIEEKMWTITLDSLKFSDLILFIVDSRSLPTYEDFKIADTIRKLQKKIILVANKSESENQTNPTRASIYELGYGEPIEVSSAHGTGLNELFETILENLPVKEDSELIEPEESKNNIRIAITGKPNVGKSLLFNSLVEKERAMVTSIAGTTRDTIDESFERNGILFTFIDTAGMRKRAKVQNYSIESFSLLRTLSAIENSDVCLLIIDPKEGITDQDKKIGGLIEEAGKASIIVFNKIDLLEKNKVRNQIKEIEKTTYEDFYFISYSKVLFVSAKEKQNLDSIFRSIEEADRSYNHTFKTSEINSALERIKILLPSPSSGRKSLKLFYATQVAVKPPVITIFVNDLSLLTESYKKALKKNLRKFLSPLEGSPLFLKFQQRREK